ncbi:putative protein TPRXL [Panonychus citri]|uniref:putative protein TPRXL n=1 Tax=Panonychus citri TaxID=50023 RepID=UPI002306DD5A|nr:putative protein TPRXL [Panonychus citri]XP_053212080.1 putative protein TPRXL [Panonychus citri]
MDYHQLINMIKLGYTPQSNMKYPYDYENTKIYINHGGSDPGRPYLGEAAYNPNGYGTDSGNVDSDYGFEPLGSGPRPYGHFPTSSSSSSSSSSTDEEDLNRGNSHDVQETSKKPSFADPPNEVEHSYKTSSSSSKSNVDLATVSTESIPDIAISNGSPISRGYSSPMPDIHEDSNRDNSNSGGFKPFFLDKNSPAGGPRKYSTVAPPILEIEAADNSGKMLKD